MTIIDPRQLMEHLEDDHELLEEAFELFREERLLLQHSLRQAVDSDDAVALESAAHSLKGMLSNFLADVPCQTIVRIQQTDPDNSDSKRELLQNLQEQLDMMEREIQQILESGIR